MRSHGFHPGHLAPVFCLLAAMSALAAFAAPAAPASARLEVLALPTYLENAPDPNPQFDQLRAGLRLFYPYPFRDRLSAQKATVPWRAVVLENVHLRCTVLPDLGGHIYSCVDKLSGQSLFYANRSIKKALVGYRGAWSAFGVEFNFPVSHNPMSMAPVDFAFGERADGSASVTVGNIDRVSGMQWFVELVLRPGRAVLEQQVTLVNRSSVRHRYYWWTNAAVEVWDDSRIQYPMRFTEGHGLSDIDTWPVNSAGVDLSLIANQQHGSVSRFVHGSREAFCGVYHPRTDTGVVHYAAYAELPGKKIWSWGCDARGLRWRTALSDDDSAYVEVQAGLMRNQETYAFLEPGQMIRFAEHWMPVRGTGGITRANLNGILSLARGPGDGGRISLTASLNVNQREEGASLLLLDGGRVIEEARISLDPAALWTRTWKDLPADRRYTLRWTDASGGVKLEHTEEAFDWTPRDPVKVGSVRDPNAPRAPSRTAPEFLDEGTDRELNGALLQAFECYENGLRRFPGDRALLKASGRLAVSLLRNELAVERLGAAGAPADAEIRYYLGLACAALGRPSAATDHFSAALSSPAFRQASCLRLAEIAASGKDLPGAIGWIRRAEDAGGLEPRAAAGQVTLLRLNRDLAAARAAAARWLGRYPTDNALRYELAKLGGPDEGLWRLLGADADRILDVAEGYMALGDWEDCAELLARDYPRGAPEQSDLGMPAPAADPRIHYYLAFALAKLGRDPSAALRTAAGLSPEYVFPNRVRSLEIFAAALERNPGDANAHLLMGELLFSRGLSEAAVNHWRKAMEANPRLPGIAYCLGQALFVALGQPAAACAVFEEGIRNDPGNAGLHMALDAALEAQKIPAAERAAKLERYPADRIMPDKLAELRIDTLRKAGRDADADRLKASHHFFAVER